ncbi:MAG: hypothetical protein ACHREM_00090 [Polyangiales bacterium]
MSDVSHIGPRSIGATVALPESFLNVAGLLGMPIPDFATAQKGFSFHLCKIDGVWGWQTHFRIGRLTLANIQWAPDRPFPRRRIDAMKWAQSFADRHGFVAMLDVDPDDRRPLPRVSRPRPKLKLIQGDKT